MYNTPDGFTGYIIASTNTPGGIPSASSNAGTHPEAKGYDLYMIEANHTRAELEARLAEKEAAGEYAYERRAAENHLSYEQAVEWLTANMGPNSLWVPMHGHKEKEVSVNAGTENACEEHY